MATEWEQINLKLTKELLEKIDAAVARAGNTNRSDWLRATITTACEGRLPSLPASGGSSADQPARDALVALKERIDELETRLENKIANAIGTAKAAHEIATDAHTAQREAKSNIDDVFSQAFSNS